MKKAITAAIAASVLMIGCTNQSTEVRKLQAENDSLLRVNAQTTADFNEMIQLMNEVEDGFRQIKEAENYLVTQKDANGEVSLTKKEKNIEVPFTSCWKLTPSLKEVPVPKKAPILS